MRWAGVAPAAWRQSVVTVAVMACTLALLGGICSLAAVPLGRACVRTVCPKKSKPCAQRGDDRLMGGEPHPACGEKGGEPPAGRGVLTLPVRWPSQESHQPIARRCSGAPGDASAPRARRLRGRRAPYDC